MMQFHNPTETEIGIYIGNTSGFHIAINRRPYSTPFSNRKYVVQCITRDKAAMEFEIEIGDRSVGTVKVESLETGDVESHYHRHGIEVMSAGNAIVVRPEKECIPAFTVSGGDFDLNNLFVISQKKIRIGNRIDVPFGPDGSLKSPIFKPIKRS